MVLNYNISSKIFSQNVVERTDKQKKDWVKWSKQERLVTCVIKPSRRLKLFSENTNGLSENEKLPDAYLFIGTFFFISCDDPKSLAPNPRNNLFLRSPLVQWQFWKLKKLYFMTYQRCNTFVQFLTFYTNSFSLSTSWFRPLLTENTRKLFALIFCYEKFKTRQ